MPLYDFRCEQGHRFERFVPLANFQDPQLCDCQSPAIRLISAPMFTVDSVGYTCPITGDWIGSKREHLENLSKHGCRVLETGEKEAAEAFRKKEDEKFEKAIEDTVERTLSTWGSDKMESLHNELVNGRADLSVERKPANASV